MDPTTEPGRDVMLERRLRAYELALDTARRDAVQSAQTLAKLSARIAELELELSRTREQPAKLGAELAEQQRARRAAEQRAHAERVHAEELQVELAVLERELSQLRESVNTATAAGEREKELEAELARLHRLADESEQVIVANRLARERAEQRVVVLTERVEELTLQAQDRGRLWSVLAELRAELDTLRALAERESAARQQAERRVEELEQELCRGEAEAPPPLDALESLRAELASLTGPFNAAAVPRVAPDADPPDADAPTEPPIEPDRFEAALKRLRAATDAAFEREQAAFRDDAVAPIEETLAELGVDVAAAALDSPPTAPAFSDEDEAELGSELARAWSEEGGAVEPLDDTRPWIGAALHRVGEPETAGRLMLGLIVAQRAVHADPLAYDIDLDGMACLQLTIDAERQHLAFATERRPPDQVRFAVTGELAGLGRLILAGRLKRRLGRGLARVHGDRGGLRALDAILDARLTLAQLRSLGLRLDPGLTLRLAAAMIEPGWTSGSHFTVAYASPGATHAKAAEGELPALVVADGLRVVVSGVAAADTIISCDPDELAAVLTGEANPDCEVRGAADPLARIQAWLGRAQRS